MLDGMDVAEYMHHDAVGLRELIVAGEVTADEVEKLSAFRDLIEDLDLSDLDPGEESPKAED